MYDPDRVQAWGLVRVQRPLPARYLQAGLEAWEDKCNRMRGCLKAGLLVQLICGPRVWRKDVE
jgi:hypothetical protein